MQALHKQVSRLRLRLGEGAPLRHRPAGYALEIDPSAIDSRRFEQLLDRARVELGRNEPSHAAADLRAALALWRGEALADHRLDEFAQREIARLEELRVEAIEERLAADLACGRDADLVGELGALVAEHPLRERLRAQLMLALYRAGRQAEALETMRAGRRLLVDELGIEPGPELRRLERMILAHDPELSADRPRAGIAPGCRRRPTRRSGGAASWRRSASCWCAPTCDWSRSWARGAWARRASRSRPRGRSRIVSRAARCTSISTASRTPACSCPEAASALGVVAATRPSSGSSLAAPRAARRRCWCSTASSASSRTLGRSVNCSPRWRT